MSGFFISFEGIDKSGTSTLARLLVDHLRSSDREVVPTHEPGSTQLGGEIRHLVLDWKPQGDIDAIAEMFLFAADRAQHVNEVIRPSLDADKVVISDRYVDSTLAYQGYGRGLNLNDLRMIQNVATGGLMPAITIWLDVDLQTARKRGWGTGADRIEKEDEAFFQRVRHGFAAGYKLEPDRIFRVDGSQPISDVFEEVKKVVVDRMSGTK